MSSIPLTMRASVLVKTGTLVVEERPVPAVDVDQVLVKVASVGVCVIRTSHYTGGRLSAAGCWTSPSCSATSRVAPSWPSALRSTLLRDRKSRVSECLASLTLTSTGDLERPLQPRPRYGVLCRS